LFYHIGDGKGFSRTGHPKQGLSGHALIYARHQLPYGFRLIAGGLKWSVKFEAGHAWQS
jgi:hypothetical protein